MLTEPAIANAVLPPRDQRVSTWNAPIALWGCRCVRQSTPRRRNSEAGCRQITHCSAGWCITFWWLHCWLHVRVDARTPHYVAKHPRVGFLVLEKSCDREFQEPCCCVAGSNRICWSWCGSARQVNSDERLCGDEDGVRKFRTIGEQPETARRRKEDVDKLVGDPYNPKPKRTTAAGGAEPPLDLQMIHATMIDQNVNPQEASEEKAQEGAGQ